MLDLTRSEVARGWLGTARHSDPQLLDISVQHCLYPRTCASSRQLLEFQQILRNVRSALVGWHCTFSDQPRRRIFRTLCPAQELSRKHLDLLCTLYSLSVAWFNGRPARKAVERQAGLAERRRGGGGGPRRRRGRSRVGDLGGMSRGQKFWVSFCIHWWRRDERVSMLYM